jgi:hypothetical protein
LTPCWPSAGPTGGAGVAAPALIWSLMTAVNRFLGGMTSFFSVDQLVLETASGMARETIRSC